MSAMWNATHRFGDQSSDRANPAPSYGFAFHPIAVSQGTNVHYRNVPFTGTEGKKAQPFSISCSTAKK